MLTKTTLTGTLVGFVFLFFSGWLFLRYTGHRFLLPTLCEYALPNVDQYELYCVRRIGRRPTHCPMFTVNGRMVTTTSEVALNWEFTGAFRRARYQYDYLGYC